MDPSSPSQPTLSSLSYSIALELYVNCLNCSTIDVDYRNQLGFNAPDGTMNLAVQDVATALAFLHCVLPSFGADPSKITLSGQSSGANMIRALLGAPSVASMFQSAILHSDTMVSLSTVIMSLLIGSSSGLWFFIYEHAEDPSKLF